MLPKDLAQLLGPQDTLWDYARDIRYAPADIEARFGVRCDQIVDYLALMGDAVSHAVLPGIVLAYIAGIPLIIGAFVAGMFCALATGLLSENSRVKQDTVMGIVFSGMFGFGIVIYTKISTEVHLDHILFGNMLGVGSTDLWTAGVIAALVATILIVKRQDILLHAFDPIQAQAVGLRVKWLHYGLLAMLSLPSSK